MKCGKCGQELRETDKFCPECGTPVEQTAPTDEIDAAKTEQQIEQLQQPDYVVCSNCKRLYKAVHTTCPYCNTAPTPPEPKICPKCGTENDPNADYCYKCFTVFSEPKKPEIDYTNFYKLNKFAIVIGALIIIAIIIYGVSASRCSKSSPESKSNYSSYSSHSDFSSKESTEKPTEKETEPPAEEETKAPTEFIDTLTELYSDNDITVYFSDVKKYSYSEDIAEVHFYVQNKTDESITFQANTVILDGRSYNKIICSDPVSANSAGMIELSVEDCENYDPSTVGADLIYFDSITYDNTVKLSIASQSVK